MDNTRNTGMRRLGMGILLAAVVAVGWYAGSRVGRDAPESASTSADDPGDAYRDIAGRVIRVSPEDGVVTMDHEEIPGLMVAMRMDLQAADPAELEGLRPGDDVIFDLHRIGETYMAVRFRRASASDEPPPSRADEPPADPLGRGDLVPDLALIDAHGRAFRLREMPQRHKVITFFYTRCPLANFCPAQSSRLAELQRHIDATDSPVHLVSLTLDARHDGTEVLAGYAQRYEADAQRWTLAGSEDADAIRAFANRVGARIHTQDDGFEIDHALIGVRVDGQRIVDFVYGLDAIEQLVQGI